MHELGVRLYRQRMHREHRAHTGARSTAWCGRGWLSPRAAGTSACPPENETVASAESALRTSVADLNAVGVRWALVGGLAVSARTIIPVHQGSRLRHRRTWGRGAGEGGDRARLPRLYPIEVLGQGYRERLFGVRMGRNGLGVPGGLPLASLGIGDGGGARAGPFGVPPPPAVSVAATPDLVGLKVLAGPRQDPTGPCLLIPLGLFAGLGSPPEAVQPIQAPRFRRGKDVAAGLGTLISDGNRWKAGRHLGGWFPHPGPWSRRSARRPPELQKRSDGPAGYDRR